LATAIGGGLRAAKCVAHELDHLARADEQHADLLQVFEELQRQAHGGGGHADRVRADLGGRCAPPWPPRSERWKSWCSVVPRVPAGLGLAHGLLHLAQDLRLAQHHGVQARWRRGRRGARRARPSRDVGVLASSVPRVPTPACCASHASGRAAPGCAAATPGRGHVQLGAVAGGQQRRLGRGALQPLAQRAQRQGQLLGAGKAKRRAQDPAGRCGG
jgi:hypothetical protein